MSEKIRLLDSVIDSAENVGSVIVPTKDGGRINRVPGSGDFTEKETVPRVKTVLFILDQEFGLDTTDSRQVSLVKGKVDGNMVRKNSYYAIVSPPIESVVLVCDEKRNATFVFNRTRLTELGISEDDLLSMTKDELRAIVDSTPDAGERIEHHADYVPRIIRALKHEPHDTRDNEGRYLQPSDKINRYALAKLLGVNWQTIQEAVSELSEKLGKVEVFNYGKRTYLSTTMINKQ